ncbi:hypothetical protein F183_A05950 [Bryobacterales bacterium F-183]|nr:hypothetical protein F183_A05950 [Bryobacterales bacterium F-183]
MNIRTPKLAFALYLLAGFTSAAKADIIIGNLPQQNDIGGSFFGNFTLSKGLGFTMTKSIDLTTAVLRLESLRTAHAPGIHLMSHSNAGLGVPNAILATFQIPTMGLGIANYVFTLPTPYRLQAGTTYWLVAAANSTTTGLNWLGSGPPVTPTGTYATYFGERYDQDGFPPTGLSPAINSFQLTGNPITAPVPEPSAVVALSAVGLLVFTRSRRRISA